MNQPSPPTSQTNAARSLWQARALCVLLAVAAAATLFGGEAPGWAAACLVVGLATVGTGFLVARMGARRPAGDVLTRRVQSAFCFTAGAYALASAISWGAPSADHASLAMACTGLAYGAFFAIFGRRNPYQLAWFFLGQLLVGLPASLLLPHGAQLAVTAGFMVATVSGIATSFRYARLAQEFQRLARAHDKALVNIEEQQRRLEEAIEVKSRFLAAASHDLRQPAQALAIYVEELSRKPGTADVTELVGRIRSATDNMTAALGALTDIALLDGKGVQPQRQPLDLGSIVERICSTFRPIAEAKGIMIRLGTIDAMVLSDSSILFSVLANLVSNAVKYTDRGVVSVIAVVDGKHVRLAVQDTGRGILEADRPFIYDEFYRGGNTGSQDTGLGLGLAIVRRLTHMADIPLHVTSAIGVGTRFELTLPLVMNQVSGSPVTRPAPERIPAGTEGSGNVLAGRTVVLLENDLTVATSMKNVLTQWGITVRDVNSLAALAALLDGMKQAPDILLVDYHLPDNATGFDAVSSVRRHFPASEVPVMMVTGDLDVRIAKAAAGQGMSLLHKPLPPSRLRRALLDLLGYREEEAKPTEFATTWPGLLEANDVR